MNTLMTLLMACLLLIACGTPMPDTAKVADAFYTAERTAALFTAYAGHGYGEGPVEVNGIRYERFTLCDTMTELAGMVEDSFAQETAAELLAATSYEGHPLYVEQDGVLYRFSGNIAQFEYRDSAAEVVGVRAGDGVIYVDVSATFDIMDEPLTVTHTYTCVMENGGYRFTGEFVLPFTVVYNAWLGRDA